MSTTPSYYHLSMQNQPKISVTADTDSFGEVKNTADDNAKASAFKNRELLWRIGRCLGLWLLGLLVVVGHFIFYNKLNGQEAMKQDYVLKAGTAFAFVYKGVVEAGVGFAIVPMVWRTVKRRVFTLGGLDRLFDIKNSIFNLLSVEILVKAGMVSFFGVSIILITVSGVLPPGTLTIERVADLKSTVDCRAPSLNMRADKLDSKQTAGEIYSIYGGRGALAETALYNGSIDGNSLISLVAYGGQILPMDNPCDKDNCTFSTSFVGPSVKCEDLAHEFERAPWNNSSRPAIPITKLDREVPLTYRAEQDINTGDIWLQWTAVKKEDMQYTAKGIPWRGFQLRKLKDGRRVDLYAAKCSCYNTSYDLDVEFRAGSPSVTNIQTKYLNPFNVSQRTDFFHLKLDERYEVFRGFGLMDALYSEFLDGYIGYQADGLYGFRYSINTKLVTTRLSQEWSIRSGELVNVTSFHPVRGLSTAIEEISRNITISILGRPNLNVEATKKTRCTELHDINAYKFDPRTFWASYSAGLLLGLIAVVVGAYCLIKTEEARDDGFSDIAVATMDQDLNEMMAKARSNIKSETRLSGIKVGFDSGFKIHH